MSVALKHINEQITPPKLVNENISDSINNIILKATSKNRNDRYESIEELKEDLARSLVDKSGSFVELREQSRPRLISINLRKSKIWKVTVIAVTLALLVTAGVFGGSALFSSTLVQPTQNVFYTLPSVTGMTIENARNIFNEQDISFSETYVNSDDVDANIVIDQSPEAGTNIQTQDSVVLTVSLGPEVIYMPNLVGIC